MWSSFIKHKYYFAYIKESIARINSINTQVTLQFNTILILLNGPGALHFTKRDCYFEQLPVPYKFYVLGQIGLCKQTKVSQYLSTLGYITFDY